MVHLRAPAICQQLEVDQDATMTANEQAHPRFDRLSDAELRDVVQRNCFGRIAFTHKGVVDIDPISYVADDARLFFRSAPGAKLEAFAHEPYVAFEIDEIEGPYDWRSVVLHGTIYRLTGDESRVGRHSYERAVAALQEVAPKAFTSADPTPEREIV